MENIYCDMDGVVADFNNEPNAVERFRSERKFFWKLKPIEENIKAMKVLSRCKNVFILTASPNNRADKDKKKWLKKYMPFIKEENIIIMRNGQKKVDFMKTANGVLFDDFGKNCNEWLERAENVSFKIDPYHNIAHYFDEVL